jgi:transposase
MSVASATPSIDPRDARIAALEALVEKLTFELATLKRQLFGRSRESAELLSRQGQLFETPATVEVDVAADAASVLPRTPKTATARAQKPKRELLPDNLPREVHVIDLPESDKAGWVQIGVDTSERLSYTPGQFFVLRTERPRYAKPTDPDAGVKQAPVPPSVIPGGILDDRVIAEIAINKFADHLPLSRQIERMQRLGIELSLSTLSDNLLTVADIWLKPMINALWQVLRQRTSLHVDETVLPTLPERNSADRGTRKTRLWTYLNDHGPPIILFHYTDTKAGSHIEEVLAHWSQSRVCYLHADAASNYEALYRAHPAIRPVNCWAHARRKFYAIASESSTRIFAHEAIEQIDALFALEREWKERSDPERQQQRQTIALPKLTEFKLSLDAKLITLAPNSATAKAISYLTKRWANFTRYVERGDLNMSNNAAERALRKAALGRKNFLFVGNERGGEAAAIYYSLIETAKANGIKPGNWLLHVLRELPKRKNSCFEAIKDLLPIQGAELL